MFCFVSLGPTAVERFRGALGRSVDRITLIPGCRCITWTFARLACLPLGLSGCRRISSSFALDLLFSALFFPGAATFPWHRNSPPVLTLCWLSFAVLFRAPLYCFPVPRPCVDFLTYPSHC